MSFASRFVVLYLRGALAVPPTKIPIDRTTFVSHVLPLLACYFIAAVLVVIPQTRTMRLALWPLIAFLTLRATLSVDMSGGKTEQRSNNTVFLYFSCSVVARTLDWALTKEPLVRHLRPANSSPSTIMDALDLVSNVRGVGWEWSRGLYVPRETRPSSRMGFVFCTFLSAAAHGLIRGATHRATLTLAPIGAGPFPEGSTIFDDTLPFLVRYLRASIISTLTAFMIYAAGQVMYELYTIPAILVLGQDPAQWPPLFDAPWRSTSLSDFWGRRWHQMLRCILLFLGGYPFSFILGRSGIVIGSFLVSAVLHHIGLIALNNRVEFWWMLVGFGMMAPGILAERAFHELTGRKVGGVAGWFWTMTWLLLWGNVIVEGFTRAGMFSSGDFMDGRLPVWMWVERLMVNFDAWLHTI